jgi:hypothetical protein
MTNHENGYLDEEYEECKCPGSEHGCPYREEINYDYEYKCSCCKACTQRCSDDI